MMTNPIAGPSRRTFLKATIASAATAALAKPFAFAQTTAKWTRYNVTSPQGQKALASYQKAIQIMLQLPPNDPHNWLRNAFTHLMDCPHGNWWFYVWHRGYIGNLEETVRTLSGDSSFALPYWDWTALPEIPAPMFVDGLTPHSPLFLPYNRDIATFTNFIKPPMTNYWSTLNADQLAQLNTRGYQTFDSLWNDVIGYSTKDHKIIPGDSAFATNAKSRYLSASNPKFDKRTAFDSSPLTINFGLSAPDFISTAPELSFNSSKQPSHNTAPGGPTSFFSTLEGLPHNHIHNYIGGVGPWDPGPYGNMTNFLSSVDPIFFLHHANMDRLWDVWTRKQISQSAPYLPTGSDWTSYKNEPFLFFVNGQGQYLTNGKAEDYVSTDRFGYNYQPGSGDDVVTATPISLQSGRTITATVHGNAATLSLPLTAIRSHLAQTHTPTLAAILTLPHPAPGDPTREFDVLIGAPAGVTHAEPGGPYYAGTISFFGNMASMPGMDADSTFVVPLPHNQHLLSAVKEKDGNVQVSVRVVPANGKATHAPVLKSVLISVN
jgi:tyrosinase